jgi:hypothetical protein
MNLFKNGKNICVCASQKAVYKHTYKKQKEGVYIKIWVGYEERCCLRSRDYCEEHFGYRLLHS